MKKILFSTLVMTLALGVSTVANAESAVTTSVNATTSTPKPKILQQIKNTRVEAREDIKEIRENLASTTREARADIKDIRQNTASTTRELRGEIKDNIRARVENRFDKMLDRFQATIERQNSIMLKINARIVKIKAEGGNTTEAEGLVAKAKIELDSAAAGLIKLESLATAEVDRENLPEMRTTAKDIEKNLREAHRNLLKSVGVLRGVSQLKNASSTTSNSAGVN